MAVFAGVVSLTAAAHRLDNRYGLGILYWLRGPVPAPEHAVVVAVDRKTINWLRQLGDDPPADGEYLLACLPTSAREDLSRIRGPSSLPRSVYGCMLQRLKDLGYPVVAFDVLFAVEGESDDDERFAQAIRQHGAVTLLVGLERSTFEEHQVQPADRFAASAAATGAFALSRTEGPAYGYWRRLPGFETMRSMPDVMRELYRREAPLHRLEENQTPNFEYFWQYGPPGSITTVSIRDVLTGEIPESVRAGAPQSAAFVGASDPDMTNFLDSFPSLLPSENGAWIGGVELAATAFLNLYHGEILRPLSPLAATTLPMAFGFAVGFLVRARGRYAMLVAPVAAAVYLGAAAVGFSQFRLFLPVAAPVFFVGPTALVLGVFVRYRFARALLMRLAPAPIAKRMLARAVADRSAEGRFGEATVLFCDMIGSSRVGETLQPVEFGTLLNAFLEMVKSSVEKHRGAVLQFQGDGLIAAFTRADAGDDHAVQACRAATGAVRELRSMNHSNRDRGLPALHMRIGINTGHVVESEIGARDRFSVTLIGDAVNLGSRLEQMGKTLFPDETEVILVGQATYACASGRDIAFADCGNQQIRGHQASAHVYRILIDQPPSATRDPGR
jgi:adenylate cyclase